MEEQDLIKQALRDFVATSNSGKYKSEDELLSKFPELSSYDKGALRDFVATSNSGKYKTEDEVFSKFPEFSPVKKKEPAISLGYKTTSELLDSGVLPKQEKPSALKTAGTTTPSVSIKRPSLEFTTEKPASTFAVDNKDLALTVGSREARKQLLGQVRDGILGVVEKYPETYLSQKEKTTLYGEKKIPAGTPNVENISKAVDEYAEKIKRESGRELDDYGKEFILKSVVESLAEKKTVGQAAARVDIDLVKEKKLPMYALTGIKSPKGEVVKESIFNEEIKQAALEKEKVLSNFQKTPNKKIDAEFAPELNTFKAEVKLESSILNNQIQSEYKQEFDAALAPLQLQYQVLVDSRQMTPEQANAEFKQKQEQISGEIQQNLNLKFKPEFDALNNKASVKTKEIQTRYNRKYQAEFDRLQEQQNDKIKAVQKKYDGIVSKEYFDEYSARLGQKIGEVKSENLQKELANFRNLPTKAKLEKALMAGWNDVLSTVGGAIGYTGLDASEINKAALQTGLYNPLPAAAFENMSLRDMLTDSDWWIVNGVRSVPFTVVTMPVGIGGGILSGTLAKALGAAKRAQVISSVVGGGVIGWEAERFLETGIAFKEAIDAGKSLGEASEIAASSANLQFATLPLNIAQMLPFFGKGFKFLNSSLLEGFSGGIEEIIQGWAGQRAKNLQEGTEQNGFGQAVNSFGNYFFSKQAMQEGAIGFAVGQTMAVGSMLNTTPDIDKQIQTIMSSLAVGGETQARKVLDLMKKNGAISEVEFTEYNSLIDYTLEGIASTETIPVSDDIKASLVNKYVGIFKARALMTEDENDLASQAAKELIAEKEKEIKEILKGTAPVYLIFPQGSDIPIVSTKEQVEQILLKNPNALNLFDIKSMNDQVTQAKIDEAKDLLNKKQQTEGTTTDGEGTTKGAISAGTNVAQEGLGVANEPSGEGVTGEGVQAETVSQAPVAETKPSENISTAADSKGVYLKDGEYGFIRTEGQLVVFETNDKIIDLGNKDELAETPISEFGIEKEEILDVQVNEDNSVVVEGVKFVNNFSNPQAAINTDADGNVVSVNLETEDGKKRTIRGQRAEEIAYQYKLKEFEQNATEESIARLEQEVTRLEEEAKKPKPQTKKRSTAKRKSKEVAPVTSATVTAPAIEVTPTAAAKPTTKPVAERIADLRAAEKSEYDAMANPKDKAKREKIYNKYDKLITPLLEEQKATEAAKAEPTKEAAKPEKKKSKPEQIGEGLLDALGLEPVEPAKKAGKKKPVNVSNKSELSELEGKAQGDKKTIIEAAKKGIATLKSVFPDMEIYIHEDPDSYNEQMGEVGGVANSRGNFAFERDANDKPTGRGRIDINLSNAKDTTVAHELVHAVLLKAFGDNPGLFKAFRDRMSKILRADLNEQVTAFEKLYAGQDVAPEEYLTELAALLSQGGETVEYKPSTLRKVAALINEFVSRITKGKFQPFRSEVDFINFVDFLNQISGAISEGGEIDDTDVLNGGGEVGTFNFTSKGQLKAPKASEDSRDFIRKLVEDVDIREFNGKKFVTNMYDYTTAGVADLGNGFEINMLGGKNYVPYMMSKKNKAIGEVSNLAAFNTKGQAESFVRNAKKGKAELFAPHSGTLSASWQFQQHTFAELVNVLLDKGIMNNAELINTFNKTIQSSQANQKAFEAFKNKYKENIKNFDSFKSDPKEIVKLLDIQNNYSPDLRKALNNAISADKTFQKAIGVKNKEEFFNKIIDPLNKGVTGGELINIVKFDPNTFEIVQTKPNAIDHHPSFGWTLLAKINGIYQPTEFHKSSEVTNSYTKYNKGGASVSRKATEPSYEKTNVSSSAGAIPKIAKLEVTMVSKSQKEAVDKAIDYKKESGTTQVATTTGSYAKAAKILKDMGVDSDVLDYGAGLGLGSDAMSNVLGFDVDSFEPNSERWKGNKDVTFRSSNDINKKYNSIVSLNVLNVVEKDIRDSIVKDIYNNLKDGGTAVISARKWSGDVNQAKNAVDGGEKNSLYITRTQGGKEVKVFQKGFDGNELVDYIKDLLGDNVTVEKNNSFGAAGVVIKKTGNIKSKAQIPTDSVNKFTIDGVEYTQEEAIEKARNNRPLGSKMEYQGDNEQAKEFVADYNKDTNIYNKDGVLKGSYIRQELIKALDNLSFNKFGDLYRKHFDKSFTREDNLKSAGGNVGRNFSFRDQASYIVGDTSYDYSDSDANFRAFAKEAGIEIPKKEISIKSKSQLEIKQRVDKASEKLKELFQRDNIPLTIAEAKVIVEEVYDWTSWYDGLSAYVSEIFGEYSEDILSMLPLASMAANSSATVGLAINNAEKIYRGEKPSGVAEYYGYVTDFLEGKGIKSDKMSEFFKALTGNKDAIAVDMHVWSIIMGKNPGKKQVNPKNKQEFDKAKEFVRTLASELDLAPREVQAALWAANILRTGGRPDSYEQYFKKQIDGKRLKERIENWRNEGYKPFSEIRKDAEASAQKEGATIKSKAQKAQTDKIKDFIDAQRKASQSDKDIKAGLELVADKVGLTPEDINNLMGVESDEAKPLKGFKPKAKPAKEPEGEKTGTRAFAAKSFERAGVPIEEIPNALKSYVPTSVEKEEKIAEDFIRKHGIDNTINQLKFEKSGIHPKNKPVLARVLLNILYAEQNAELAKNTTDEAVLEKIAKDVYDVIDSTLTAATEAAQFLSLMRDFYNSNPYNFLMQVTRLIEKNINDPIKADVSEAVIVINNANQAAAGQVASNVVKEVVTPKVTSAKEKFERSKANLKALWKKSFNVGIAANQYEAAKNDIQFAKALTIMAKDFVVYQSVQFSEFLKEVASQLGLQESDIDQDHLRKIFEKAKSEQIQSGIKVGLKELELKLKDLIESHYSSNEIEEKLIDKLKKEFGVGSEFGYNDAAIKELENAIKREIKVLTAKEKIKALNAAGIKDKKDIDLILGFSEAGLLEDNVILENLGEKLGIKKLTAAEAKKLGDIAKDINDSKEDVVKARNVQRFEDFKFVLSKKYNITDFLISNYLTNIFGSLASNLKNIASNVTETSGLVGELLGNALISGNPKDVQRALQALTEGSIRGFDFTKEVLSTGVASYKDLSQIRARGMWELIMDRDFDLTNTEKLLQFMFKLPYIGPTALAERRTWNRFLLAGDAFSSTTNSEIGSLIAATREADKKRLRGNERTNFISEQMANSPAAKAEAREYALSLGYKEGTKAFRRAVSNYLVSKRPEAIKRFAAEYSGRATLTQQPPTSTFTGFVASMLNNMTAKNPILKLYLPVVNTFANLIIKNLERSPFEFLSLGFDYARQDLRTQEGAKAGLTKEEVARRLKTATVFTAIGVLLFIATGGTGDDEEGVQIYGSGTGDPALDKARRALGWKPNTIRFSKEGGYFNFEYLPVGFLLGMVGNMRDYFRYRNKPGFKVRQAQSKRLFDKNLDELTESERTALEIELTMSGNYNLPNEENRELANMAQELALSPVTYSFQLLKSLGELVEGVSDGAGFFKTGLKSATNIARGVAAPRYLGEVRDIFDNNLYDTKEFRNVIGANIPAITLGNVMLDGFGREIKKYQAESAFSGLKYMIKRGFYNPPIISEIDQFLWENRIAVSVPSNPDSVNYTDEVLRDYIVLRGSLLLDKIGKAMNERKFTDKKTNLQFTPQQTLDIINGYVRESNEQAQKTIDKQLGKAKKL